MTGIVVVNTCNQARGATGDVEESKVEGTYAWGFCPRSSLTPVLGTVTSGHTRDGLPIRRHFVRARLSLSLAF